MRTFQERAKRFLPVITAAIFLAVVVAYAGIALAAEPSAAQLTNKGLTDTASEAGLGTTPRSIPEIVGTLIYAALSLTGVIFVILMVYAGYLWMQARGNDDDVKKAKDIITNAIIGIIITALAFAITNFILNRIVESTSGTTVIDSGGGLRGSISPN